MKIPNRIRTYCPKCRKHTGHKVKEGREGKRRTMAWGQQKHIRKTKGYTSKVAGQAKRVKQRKKTKLMLECTVCKKKHPRILPDSKKKTEITKR